MSEARAVVDVGTNSVRLLVVDGGGDRLDRQLMITRLGAGVDETGHLDDAALARTRDALATFRARWHELGVTDRVRIAATSAVRDAADRDRFFAMVREVTGHDAEVLSGEDEAALAFAGAAHAVGGITDPVLVADVGGGSTELTLGDRERGVHASVSLQLGCVRLTERHLHADPATTDQLAAAQTTVDRQLALGDASLDGHDIDLRDAATLVAVAGTATTLAAVHLGLTDYEEHAIHGARVPAAALHELTVRLGTMTSAERRELGPMQPGREDVIHGGALVLDTVMQRYGLFEMIVSEADNLDGLAASLA